MSHLEHEGSDYPFINNEARQAYEEILLAAYERSSPLSSTYRPNENSTIEEDLETIAEYTDDDGYVERHHPLPESLGGTKKRGFVTVQLTFAEHFRCHQLLIDFTEGEDRRSMLYALGGMMRGKAREKILTPEQYAVARQAHKEAVKGRTYSAEVRANMSIAHLGKTHSATARANMSAAQRGKTVSPETRMKIGDGNRGKKLSAETRAKMRASRLGKPLSLEHRAKLRKPRTLEQRAAQSARLLGQTRAPFSPAARMNIGNASRGRKVTVETRKKLSACQKGKPKGPLSPVAYAALRAAMAIKTECPHCRRYFDPASYGRYHGDRCKPTHGPISAETREKLRRAMTGKRYPDRKRPAPRCRQGAVVA